MPASLKRLRIRPQFLRIAAQGCKAVTRSLVLQAAPAPTHSPISDIQIGFTVTRKVGNAVIRNRVRRRLKAAAADIFPANGRPGYEYVVIGRYAAIERSYPELLQDLKKALKHVHHTDANNQA